MEGQEALQTGARPLPVQGGQPAAGEDEEPLTNQGPPRAQGDCRFDQRPLAGTAWPVTVQQPSAGSQHPIVVATCRCELLACTPSSSNVSARHTLSPDSTAADPSQAKLRPEEEPGEAHPGTSPGLGLKQNPTAAPAWQEAEGGQGSTESGLGATRPSANPTDESQQAGRAAEAARTVMWAAKEGAGEAAATAEGAKAASEAGQTVADKGAAAAQSARTAAAEGGQAAATRVADAAQSVKAAAGNAGQAAATKAAAAGQAVTEGAQQAAAEVQGATAGAGSLACMQMRAWRAPAACVAQAPGAR